jgi:hypothetical protein
MTHFDRLKEYINKSFFIRLSLNLFTVISMGLTLNIITMHQTFPNYLYELHQRILVLNLAFFINNHCDSIQHQY